MRLYHTLAPRRMREREHQDEAIEQREREIDELRQQARRAVTSLPGVTEEDWVEAMNLNRTRRRRG